MEWIYDRYERGQSGVQSERPGVISPFHSGDLYIVKAPQNRQCQHTLFSPVGSDELEALPSLET